MNKYNLWTRAYHLNSEGRPFVLTEGQEKIFEYIYEPEHRRVGIKTVTQYGKSDVTSMAIIHSLIDNPKKILLVAPSIKQSEIIMGNIIMHLFDHPDIEKMLLVDESLERLKRERSKKRLTLKNNSEVAILTADVRTVSQEAKGLMGFGAHVVIVDESGLIPDDMYGKILRMVGGTQGKLVQLGNPFPSKHFQDCFTNPDYHTLTVDYHQAIAEGRLTQDFIDEARRTITPFDFEVFYECKFPEEKGNVFRSFMHTLTAKPLKPMPNHLYVMGVDLARTQDYTVISVYDRRTNAQVYQDRFHQLDWSYQKKKIAYISQHYNNAVCVIDATGLGDPIAEDLIRTGISVIPIRINASNKKEMIEKMVIWLEQGAVQLLRLDDTILELEKFTYEKSPSGYMRYLARQGYNDDIIIANALALWELNPIIKRKEEPVINPIRRAYLDKLKAYGNQVQDWEEVD